METTGTGLDNKRYEKARTAYSNKNYSEAIEIFKELGSYKDSQNMIKECEVGKKELKTSQTLITVTFVSIIISIIVILCTVLAIF